MLPMMFSRENSNYDFFLFVSGRRPELWGARGQGGKTPFFSKVSHIKTKQIFVFWISCCKKDHESSPSANIPIKQTLIADFLCFFPDPQFLYWDRFWTHFKRLLTQRQTPKVRNWTDKTLQDDCSSMPKPNIYGKQSQQPRERFAVWFCGIDIVQVSHISRAKWSKSRSGKA